MAIATINPATGQLLKTFESLSDAQIEVKLQKAADTFLSYRKVPFAERAQMMLKAAAIATMRRTLSVFWPTKWWRQRLAGVTSVTSRSGRFWR